MSALPCQPVPTISQREQLAAFNAKHHGVRQYEQNQPRISTVEAAGMACCDVTPDVPRPGEDGEPQVWAWAGSTPVLVIVAAACVAWVAYWWSYV